MPQSSAIASTITRTGAYTSSHGWANAGTGTRDDGVVGAQHSDSRAELGSTERDHVLPDVGRNNVTMLRGGVCENVLNQVIAILVAGDVDQGNPGTVDSALTHSIKVSTKEVGATNLQTLFNHLGGELVHTVLGSIADNVVDSPAPVRRCTVLTDMLNAPVSKLAVGDDVDVCQNFLDAGALYVQLASLIPHLPSSRDSDLVLFKAILKNILNHQASGFSQGNLVPHASQGLVHVLHDLGR